MAIDLESLFQLHHQTRPPPKIHVFQNNFFDHLTLETVTSIITYSVMYDGAGGSRRLGNISSKPLSNVRVPLGGITPRATNSRSQSSSSVKPGKTMMSSPSTDKMKSSTYSGSSRYPSTVKRIVPSGMVLLDKAVSSPRPREYPPVGKNGISTRTGLAGSGNNKHHKDTSSSDTTPNSKSPTDLTSASADKSGDSTPKKAVPPALRLDFIKAALSGGKQVYSNQEIREKAAVWGTEPKHSSSHKKTKSKSKLQSHSSSSSDISHNAHEPKKKTYESLKNEGFAPRGKSNELNLQIKALKKRLGAEAFEEEEVMEEAPPTPQAGSSLFGFYV